MDKTLTIHLHPRPIILAGLGFAIFLSLMCACAILTGALIGPLRTALAPGRAGPAAQSTPEPGLSELLATPLIDIQVTLWDGTPVPASPTSAEPTPGAAVPPALPSWTPTRPLGPTSLPFTPAPTLSPPASPLATPEAGR